MDTEITNFKASLFESNTNLYAESEEFTLEKQNYKVIRNRYLNYFTSAFFKSQSDNDFNFIISIDVAINKQEEQLKEEEKEEEFICIILEKSSKDNNILEISEMIAKPNVFLRETELKFDCELYSKDKYISFYDYLDYTDTKNQLRMIFFRFKSQLRLFIQELTSNEKTFKDLVHINFSAENILFDKKEFKFKFRGIYSCPRKSELKRKPKISVESIANLYSKFLYFDYLLTTNQKDSSQNNKDNEIDIRYYKTQCNFNCLNVYSKEDLINKFAKFYKIEDTTLLNQTILNEMMNVITVSFT